MIVFKQSFKPGFNFIEMMVALVIIGIIVGLIGPRMGRLLGLGKTTATQNTLRVITSGIQEYQISVGRYPDKLEDLVKKPEGVTGWNGPYVGDEKSANPEVPRDSWDQDFEYKLNERGAKPPYELYSLGDPTQEDDRIYAK